MTLSPSRIFAFLTLCTLPCAAAASIAVQSQPQARATLFTKSPTPLAPNVYCKINGLEITRAEFGDWLQQFRGDNFIQEYVLARLVREKGKQAGVEVPREELDQAVNRQIEERIMSGYRGRKEMFIERELANLGKSIEDYKKELAWSVETEMLVAKILKSKRLTTDSDVEAEFRRLYGTSGRELYLRAILIEPNSPSLTSHRAPEEVSAMYAKFVEEAQKKAAGIVKNLLSGATDFKSQALAYSDDYRSKIQGGDIGKYVSSPPMFGVEFDRIIQKTVVGKVVGPVRIQSGFLIAEITKEVPHDYIKERDAIRKELVEREPTPNEVVDYKGRILQEASLVR